MASKYYKTQMHDSYKLVTFNVYDYEPRDDTGRQGAQKCKGGDKRFEVQMFGINEKGETAAIFVEGFTPFFYVKVNDDWTESDRTRLILQMQQDMGAFYRGSIMSSKLVTRKTLYGFDAGKLHSFIIIKFRNESALRKAKGLWYTYNEKKERVLDPNGYECDSVSGVTCCTLLYEAQVPPLLRLFHIKEISPSGWIALPKKHALKHDNVRSTSCTHEYTINYAHIIALNQKEDRVPYKICAFDIEASSSHGDFPLAKKTYKKLAENIVDALDEHDSEGSLDAFLTSSILTAFRIPGNAQDGIQCVYPQYKLSYRELLRLIADWKTLEPSQFCAHGEDDSEPESSDDEQDVDEGAAATDAPEGSSVRKRFPRSHYRGKGTVLDMLLDAKATRRQLVRGLDLTLCSLFPQLHGDEVTFIGSS